MIPEKTDINQYNASPEATGIAAPAAGFLRPVTRKESKTVKSGCFSYRYSI